jgi:hypothetical protein
LLIHTCVPVGASQAWLRSRGTTGGTVYTADNIAEQFGVVKSSYEGVPLPPRSVLTAVCKGPGKPQEQVQLVAQPLPTELEWGQVSGTATCAG